MDDSMHDQIAHLRTRGALRDGLALRAAAERALAGLSLAPAALPDAAILCLRRVQARLDLHQALQGRAARQAGLQAQAEAAWAAAARPWQGPVGANSPAVWFADEAELLACLAQDQLRGATRAWWWAALLGPVVDAGALQRRWLAQAAAAPAALQRLAASGQAAAVLHNWPSAFCTHLAARLAALYGVSAWPPATVVERVPGPSNSSAQPGVAPAAATAVQGETWQALLRLCPGLHTLAQPQRQLWALATLLAQVPAQAAQPGVAAALQAALGRWREVSAPPATEAPDNRDTAGPAATAGLNTATAGATATTVGAAPAHPGDDPSRARASPSHRRRPPGDVAAAPAMAGTASSPRRTAADERTPDQAPASPAMPAPQRPALEIAPPADTALPRPPLSARSPHAGLLYALRLALQLGLYGDFTQVRRPGITLAPADWLALVGLRLFGPAFRADPLWTLLAGWAGRASAQAPGQGFHPPNGQALQPWLGSQLSHCQRLARRALPQQRQALRWLCRRPGLWRLSSSRLDVHFGLAGHPLAIRQAGLDRDPGWLPAGGLAVWLHFD